MKKNVVKKVVSTKKLIVSLFVATLLCITFASCSSKKCDAYKSSHRYHREIIR